MSKTKPKRLDAGQFRDLRAALKEEEARRLQLDLRGVKEGQLVVVSGREYEELQTLRAKLSARDAEIGRTYAAVLNKTGSVGLDPVDVVVGRILECLGKYRCFACGEVTDSDEEAAEHFKGADPACIATLRARVAELEGPPTLTTHAEQVARAEKAEAELDAAHERLDEFGMRRDGTTATLVEGIGAMRARIDEYRARAHKGEMAEADLREVVEALRGLRREVSAKLTGRDSEPGEFEKAWQTACAVLAKHPVKP